jgi:hypothetical protein
MLYVLLNGCTLTWKEIIYNIYPVNRMFAVNVMMISQQICWDGVRKEFEWLLC